MRRAHVQLPTLTQYLMIAAWLCGISAAWAAGGLIGALLDSDPWTELATETVGRVGTFGLAFLAHGLSKKVTALTEAAEEVAAEAQKVIEKVEKLPPR